MDRPKTTKGVECGGITRCTMEREPSVRVLDVCFFFAFAESLRCTRWNEGDEWEMSTADFQAMEMTSFSRPPDEIIDIWSVEVSPGSVRAIPTLNSEAFNLLMLP